MPDDEHYFDHFSPGEPIVAMVICGMRRAELMANVDLTNPCVRTPHKMHVLRQFDSTHC